MGYIRHDAIVVTSCQTEAIEEAHALACRYDLRPTGITDETTNWYRSFLIPPDGSKEGWSTSDDFKEAREAWKRESRILFNDATNKWIYWVHIQYAGDEAKDTRIIDQEPKQEAR